MACSLQKLFTVEEEFEDEDFLSAVEDVENHFAGTLPRNTGCPRPVSSRPQETPLAQSSELLPLQPTAPSEALSLPAQGLCLRTPSMPQTIRDPPSTEAPPLRPVLTSSNWTHDQRMTLTEVLRAPAQPRASAPQPRLTLESHQQGSGDFEAPEQDEFDKALASMELEGAGMELGCGVNSEAIQILPAQQQQDPVLAKKARFAVSGSFQKGPVPAACTALITAVQGEPREPVVHYRTPWPHFRPGAAVPAALAASTQELHCPKGAPVPVLRPPQPAGVPTQSNRQNHLSSPPLQAPSTWSSPRPRFPGPQTSKSSSSVFSRGFLRSWAPLSSVDCPVSNPKAPHSSVIPQAVLQTPIVTNHLVQLVTAANRTPQRPIRTPLRAKTRRFPGPAGLLPHQHSEKNLEEIMVSTPQTPTHGALAKFRTEVITSSQGSMEEDFGRGAWLTMKSALGLDERDPTCFLCTYSIVMVLRKAALKQLPRNKVPNMAVMIKSLTRSTMDASVVFKDPTGEMLGTVHRVLLETRQNELKPGAVLLLKQVGVFSPSLRNHYLNVTPNNLVHIYSSDPGDGNVNLSQPLSKDPGSFEPGVATEKPEQSPRTAQNPEEELPEADDLDGLLSELPEDFFCGPSS